MGLAYRLAARVGHRAPHLHATLRRSLAGRRSAHRRWADWAGAPEGATTLWVHAASVGEAQAVEPVVRCLRAARPTLRVALTHTSPSVIGFPLPWADRVDYLPLDEPGPVKATLAALRPGLLLFSRGDLWPELVTGAAAREVPIAVAGATVRPGSLRLRWPVRTWLRRVYRSVRFLGAVSVDDADRWTRLGVARSAIAITGDPRHDQLLERLPDLGALAPLRAWTRSSPVLVAGSTEPADEPILYRWAVTCRETGLPVRVLVVPHDPTECRARAAHVRAQQHGLTAQVWNGGDLAGTPAIVIVARRGVLADLYAFATAAYVGGGFRRGGLHAVAEPAAWGVPVIMGPYWRAASDAAALVAVGGGYALGRADAHDVPSVLRRWLGERAARYDAGRAARRVLARGASTRTASALAPLLSAPTLGRI